MYLLPHYIHIINPKLKHIYLTFNDTGELVIKSPKVSVKQIEQVLLKKAAWINSAREKLSSKKGKRVQFEEACELYFLGQSHTLQLIRYEKKRTKLTFDGDCFTLYYSTYDESVFQRHIDNFYKIEAQQYIPPLVSQWAKTMQVIPKHIRFRKTKRQWGSCSTKNTLSFNTMMMKLPIDAIQYIVVHELAHITHKHHQQAFWQLVATYLPDYKSQVQTLKHYST